MQQRLSILTSLATMAVLGLSACGADDTDPMDTGSDGAGGDSGGSLVVGSANFAESVLLAEIYAGALDAAGVQAETKPNIGARETYLAGIEDGSIDIIPEYTGNLRLYYDEDAKASDPEGVYQELKAALPEELTVLDYAEAQDKDAVVVTRETADEHSLTGIADLAGKNLVLGGPPEWKTRSTGLPGLEKVYGVTFKDFVELDAGGPLTLNALLEGRIDAGNLFSTNPHLAAEDLVVLDDPESLFAAQNVVPLLRAEVVDDEVTEALNGVSGELDTETLGALVTRVDIDKEDPEDVAADFLSETGLE